MSPAAVPARDVLGGPRRGRRLAPYFPEVLPPASYARADQSSSDEQRAERQHLRRQPPAEAGRGALGPYAAQDARGSAGRELPPLEEGYGA